MTIGIQGDWGTGKTSMINIIRHKLNAVPGNPYRFERVEKTGEVADLVPRFAAKETEAARFRRFVGACRDAVSFESSDGSFSENEAKVLKHVLNSAKVTVVSDAEQDAGDDESIPGYVRGFFSALIGAKLKQHQAEDIERSREGRTSYYGLTLYCDKDAEYY